MRGEQGTKYERLEPHYRPIASPKQLIPRTENSAAESRKAGRVAPSPCPQHDPLAPFRPGRPDATLNLSSGLFIMFLAGRYGCARARHVAPQRPPAPADGRHVHGNGRRRGGKEGSSRGSVEAGSCFLSFGDLSGEWDFTVSLIISREPVFLYNFDKNKMFDDF